MKIKEAVERKDRITPKIVAWLEKQPDDEVFMSNQLVKLVGVGNNAVARSNPSTQKIRPDHYQEVRGVGYWGSRKAIQNLRKIRQEAK